MRGAKFCEKKKIGKVEKKQVDDKEGDDTDFKDPKSWYKFAKITKQTKTLKVGKVQKKNTAVLRVGNEEAEMFTDSGAEATIIPTTCYKKGMGKLQETNQ